MGCNFSKKSAAKPAELEPKEASLVGGELVTAKRPLVSTSSSADTFRTSQEEERNDQVNFTNTVVDTLLSGIGLPQYVDAFKRSGYDDKSVLLDITEKDFREIESFAGLTILPGHRKRIILASKRLLGGSGGIDLSNQSESQTLSARGLRVNTPTGSSHSAKALGMDDLCSPPSYRLPIESHALNSTSVSASGRSEENVLYLSFGTDKLEGELHLEENIATKVNTVETETEDRFDDIEFIGDGNTSGFCESEAEPEQSNDKGIGDFEKKLHNTSPSDANNSAVPDVPREEATIEESQVELRSEKAKAVLDTTSEEKEVLPLASEMPKIVLTRKRKSHKEEEEEEEEEEVCDRIPVEGVVGKENFLPSTVAPLTQDPGLCTERSSDPKALATSPSYKPKDDFFVSKFKEAFEASMKMKIAALSDTVNNQRKVSPSSPAVAGSARKRRGSGKKLEHIEKSIKNTEFQVKKRIMDIVDNYTYKS